MFSFFILEAPTLTASKHKSHIFFSYLQDKHTATPQKSHPFRYQNRHVLFLFLCYKKSQIRKGLHFHQLLNQEKKILSAYVLFNNKILIWRYEGKTQLNKSALRNLGKHST